MKSSKKYCVISWLWEKRGALKAVALHGKGVGILTMSDATVKTVRVRRIIVKALKICIFLILVNALIIKPFIGQVFKVNGYMGTVLIEGDHFFVNKLPYYFGKPERGDIIVFSYPLDTNRDMVSRCIGLEGETLEINENIVYINGKPLDEPYVIYSDENQTDSKSNDHFGPVKIPDNHVFVMYDNRSSGGNFDSRESGTLPIKPFIHGRASIIHWSWKDDGSFGVRWDRMGNSLTDGKPKLL